MLCRPALLLSRSLFSHLHHRPSSEMDDGHMAAVLRDALAMASGQNLRTPGQKMMDDN